MNLFQFLKDKKDKAKKLSYVEAIVLMLNIVKGIRYLHSKQMTHFNLNPRVLPLNVNVDSYSKLLRACLIKITNFSLIKTKNIGKTNKDQIWNIDTSRFMVPKVVSRKDTTTKKLKFDVMQADIYSFGILYYEILFEENIFRDLGGIDFKKKLKVNDSC